MKTPFSSRLWLAWQVLAGRMVSWSADYRSIQVEFVNDPEFRQRFKMPGGGIQ